MAKNTWVTWRYFTPINGVITLLTTGSRGPPLSSAGLKRPLRLAPLIQAVKEAGFKVGNGTQWDVKIFMSGLKMVRVLSCFNPSPLEFLLKHMSEWLFHALSYYLFLYGFGSRFQFESGELFPKPLGAEGKVWLRKWPDQLLANYIASFKPDVKL